MNLINCGRVIRILNSCIRIRIHYLVCSSLSDIIRKLILFSNLINNLCVIKIVPIYLFRNWKSARPFFAIWWNFSWLLLQIYILPSLPVFVNLFLCYIVTSFDFICCKNFIFCQKKMVGHIFEEAILIQEVLYFIVVFLWQ